MVCLGNICRSPLAEGILKHKVTDAGLSWQVESAGTNSYHTGEPPHHLSQKVAQLNGINICEQRARRFKTSDLDEYDILYAMSNDVIEEMKRIAGNKWQDKKVKLIMDELYPSQQLDVPDPWYGPEPGYHDVYKMIEAACEKIMQQLPIKN
ncbi:MAG: low molecular weight phosphotyrosine protein phosphatase [Chitinophagaceae bacterium]|nr:low molecular weight phosphotyrosine protein phosphatase [Chitinophagaceae bacterium]